MKRLKRYRYPLIGFALLVLLLVGWTRFQIESTSSRINANFAKIKKGMTQEEVYSLLGDLPSRYTSFPSGSNNPGGRTAVWVSSEPPWAASETWIIVEFDKSNRVEKADMELEKRSLKERF